MGFILSICMEAVAILTIWGRKEREEVPRGRQPTGRPWLLGFNMRTVSCKGWDSPIILLFNQKSLFSLLRSLLGLESHPSPQMGMTATNINVGPPTEPVYNRHQGQNRADVHNYGVSQWLKYYRHGVVQSSSSEDDSSSDSEEEDCVEVTGDESKQVEDILGVDSFHEKKVEVDPSEEEYFRFLAVSEKHKKERDGVEGESLKKKFDFRTDTITDAVLEEGLALIDTDHEKTKREMGKLFGSRAMKVHSEETKVC